ncbi:ATP-dependent helicase [Butyrivibrio sp. VCD2006]|uniref:ATP-dependent helicase n=1 Tax=Butyrivibrio sp. VCD2006 TaxID=1280664 RepID=UPI0003FD6BA5|nr:ATP-dependent helicase [Butyrivibrio sp. VCD2006]
MNDNDFYEKYLTHLSAQQLDAVRTTEGPVLLLAVPGSGKTTVLVNRLGYMLYCKGMDPSHILTLTYTVAATKDMAERFKGIFGEDVSTYLEFRTINGICAKIIQHYGRLIGKKAYDLVTDEKFTGKIITDIFIKEKHDYPTESDIKGVRTLITYCKNMMLSPEEIKKLDHDLDIDLLSIYEAYNAELKNRGLMDYDDQMVYAYRMLKGSPELLKFYQDKYRYICVDEAQDTSKVQHMIIGLLSGKNGNLFMVGDEDQSIYGFRAAYPEALLNFEKDHPSAKVLVMDKNFRSNAAIVSAADVFISHNDMRHDKHMQATREKSSDINYIQLNSRRNQYNYLAKVAADVKTGTAVLYRDNESIIPLVDVLDRQGISYRIRNADVGFFTHRVVMDILSIIKFCMNPYDAESFLRIYFKCQTYLKKMQAERLCSIAANMDLPILDAVEETEMLNFHVKGKCRSLRTHLANMRHEEPYKALTRIERFMGYGEYMENNHLDTNKLFTLKMIAGGERTLDGFMRRLQELQIILRDKEPDYSSKFILSTIHSSKGLEYDEVYLMDACDGVFPSQIPGMKRFGDSQELKDFEEERRIFYVGMTRARNKLNILTYNDEESTFVHEITSLPGNDNDDDYESSSSLRFGSSVGASDRRRAQTSSGKTKSKAAVKKMLRTNNYAKKSASATDAECPTELVIGQRILQPKYGKGFITDVDVDEFDIPTKFSVQFDDGEERKFMYPFAFNSGMKLI